MSRFTLHLGDCLESLRAMPENSIDAIVTDPPYGLAFMGKKWDYDVPSEAIWRECLRVLKPGGHLLAFAGTRTQHRMAVRIEDAGFEIRDLIAWVYGSGFPKSLDVSKALDKINAEAGRLHKFTEWMRSTGVTAKQINAATGTFMASHYLTAGSQPAIPTPELWAIIRPMCGDVPPWVDELVARISAEREVIGQDTKARSTSGASALPTMGGATVYQTWDITAPATDAARQWQGWGTALKPALEPITVARKPLSGTVAANVLEHGTGALNIDGCRVGDDAGRWPANLIHDGSEEVLAVFPQAPGQQAKASADAGARKDQSVYSGPLFRGSNGAEPRGDAGSAARFFYCAKASRADRNEGIGGSDKPAVSYGAAPSDWENADWKARNGNHHPTVKPTDLMRYLCRLVTPTGGIVLDPFMGSGSTGKAAMLEGFRFIGCELSPEYLAIARSRIEHAAQESQPKPAAPVPQLDLFEEAA